MIDQVRALIGTLLQNDELIRALRDDPIAFATQAIRGRAEGLDLGPAARLVAEPLVRAAAGQSTAAGTGPESGARASRTLQSNGVVAIASVMTVVAVVAASTIVATVLADSRKP